MTPASQFYCALANQPLGAGSMASCSCVDCLFLNALIALRVNSDILMRRVSLCKQARVAKSCRNKNALLTLIMVVSRK